MVFSAKSVYGRVSTGVKLPMNKRIKENIGMCTEALTLLASKPRRSVG